MRILGLSLLLIGSALSFVGALPTAHAQVDLVSQYNPAIDVGTTVEIRPLSPEPGQRVTAKLNDYGIQSDTAQIYWYLDGVEQPDFFNQRVFTFTAGALGNKNRVSVELRFPDGRTVDAVGTAPSAYIDIVLEADTYVPQFYVGRPLPTNNSTVRATALVSNGSEVNSETYVYKWTIANKVLQGGALRGARTVLFEVPFRNGNQVQVEIFDLNGEFVGQANLPLPQVRPELKFYERSTLYGLRQQALGSEISQTIGSLTIQAVPYHLDTETLLGSNTLLRWRADYNEIPNSGTNPLMMTLEPSGVSGSTLIDFRIQDRQQYLQGAEGSITVRNN